ncbi:MAG: hypothetical protein JNK05_36035 [Myxococcales bacterium]|nr:hypothetical protein [Myxococcales bacterium]
MLRDPIVSLALASLLAGCASRAEAQPRPPPQHAADTQSVDATAPAQPTRCDADADCDWDNPCVPTACVQRGRHPPLACTETRPPPGECGCHNGTCTLRRRDLASTRSPERGCRTSAECRIDNATGVCHVRRANDPGTNAVGQRFCDCEASTQTCVQREPQRVQCRTWRDCSWQHNPLRAVSSRQVRRPVARPVRACRDGEVDSICVEGVCRITAWGC